MHKDKSALGRRIGDGLATLVAVPMAYFVCAKFGVVLTVMPEGTAILWPANSVLLAALILRRGQGWLPLSLLTLGAELLADVPAFSVGEALLFGTANVSEAMIAFLLLKRLRFDPSFATLADVPRFVIAGPVIAALLASALGAAVYAHFRGSEISYLQFARLWWFGDAIGLLIFTPLVLSFALGTPGLSQALRAARPIDGALVGLALASAGLFMASLDGVLWGMSFRPILMLPFAILVAARFEMRVVTGTVSLMALAVVVAATRGRAPFGPVAAREVVLRTQEFLLVLSVVPLGLASLLAQLRAQHAAVRAVNERLNELNRHLEARVVQRTANLNALNADLERLAMHDPLTGLFNRRAFFERAQQEFERCRRHRSNLAVLMVDIDHFKAINDHYGHLSGDRVLQRVADVIAASLRPEDTIGRYGGEEFAVLVPGADLQAAVALATRVQREMARERIPHDHEPLHITASVGVASLGAEDASLQSLLKRADDALYAAKRAGRNCVMPVAAA